MNNKRNLLIYGAGAIGRGYIPWVFFPTNNEFYYVETNKWICDTLNKNKKYNTYRIVKDRYIKKTVPIKKCYMFGEEKQILPEIDAVITSAGSRNIKAISENLKGTSMPILCFENDDSLPELMQSITKNPNVSYAIPDVITSNIAPKKLTDIDELAIVTEDGTCFIDEKAKHLGGNCNYINKNELSNQWIAKLYLHNTPHCISAYMGYIKSLKYLHNSLSHIIIRPIVMKVMDEMKRMVSIKFDLDDTFIDWYADKEIKRFENVLLHDPISRVAREPLRKLSSNGRLIGAARMCLDCGFIPEGTILGIMSAICYNPDDDPDSEIMNSLYDIGIEKFLEDVIKLDKNEKLYKIIVEKWNKQ